MKQWTREIEIHAPIEHVWKWFDGSLEHMQKIMPQVVDHKPVKITEEQIGSVYRQTYKEGKRIQEYDVETLDYKDAPDQKKLAVGFTLANMFDITASYELFSIDDNKTLFRYTVTNRPLKLKWLLNFIISLSNDKVITEFLDRVKHVSESDTP